MVPLGCGPGRGDIIMISTPTLTPLIAPLGITPTPIPNGWFVTMTASDSEPTLKPFTRNAAESEPKPEPEPLKYFALSCGAGSVKMSRLLLKSGIHDN